MSACVEDGLAVRECVSAADMRAFFALAPQLARRGWATDEQSVRETKRVIRLCEAEGKRFRYFACFGADERAVCRCVLSWRQGWDAGHVGFFESDGNERAVRLLFAQVSEVARKMGLQELVGPVNGSIWDAYRYKVGGFECGAYTCDRDTPRGYPRLWEAAGFECMETWHSDLMGSVLTGRPKAKLERRLARALELGYRFAYVGEDGFSRGLTKMWRLIVELYAGFPAYEPVSEAGFKARFGKLQPLLDPQCALLVYDKEGMPVGFGVALPDYTQVVGAAKGLFGRGVALVRTRAHAARYVIAYVGVAPGHEGLGGALCALLARRQVELGAEGIAALMATGKPTASYAGSQAIPTWHYVLYHLPL